MCPWRLHLWHIVRSRSRLPLTLRSRRTTMRCIDHLFLVWDLVPSHPSATKNVPQCSLALHQKSQALQGFREGNGKRAHHRNDWPLHPPLGDHCQGNIVLTNAKKNQRNTPFMYILCQGRVQLYDEPVVFNNDLQRVPVASLKVGSQWLIKEGDIFGHECFFNSKGHEYTAKSLTFTKLLRLDYDTFYSIIKSSRKDLVSSKS
jgi:hypothetical protein